MGTTSASYRTNVTWRFVWSGCLVVFFITHFLSSTVAQTTSTWDGSTGVWSDFTRWSTDPFYPDNGNGGVNYIAVINGGVVTLDVDVTLDGLNLLGGSLTGSNNLNVGTFVLDNATLSTSGNFNITGASTLNSGTIARNLSLAAVSGNVIRNVTIDDGFTLTNPFGSILTADATSAQLTDGLGSLVNDGTFNKIGLFRHTVAAGFTNNGLVDVQSGQFRTGQATHNGQVNIAGGATFEVVGDSTFNPGSSVTGSGIMSLLNNTATINGSVNVGQFILDGGTLAGSGSIAADRFFFHDNGTIARDLTLTQTANHEIRNVTINDGFTLTNPVGATLTANTTSAHVTGGLGSVVNDGTFNKIAGFRYTVATDFTNNGLVDVQSGQFRVGSATINGQVNIASLATFEVVGDSTFTPGSSVTGSGNLSLLNNTATINGSVNVGQFILDGGTLVGSGSLVADRFFFHDNGTIARDLTLTQTANHEIRNVTINDGFTLTNPVGATLTANTTSAHLTNGLGSVVNDGTFNKIAGFRYTVENDFTNNGLIDVQSGQFRVGSATHNGQVNIASGATFEVAGDSTFTPGSSVTGSGNLTLHNNIATIDGSVNVGTFILDGGTLAGSGSIAADRFFFHDNGTIARDLTLTQTANHEIRNVTINDGFTLTNPVGATLTANTTSAHLTDGLGSVVNDGTFNKIAGFRYTVETDFTNNGLVDVQSGQFRAGSATHTGQVNIAGGAMYEASGTQDFVSGSSITGAGSVLVTGAGRMTVVGDGGHTYSGGTTIENGGDVLITGTGLGLGSGAVNVNSGGSLRLTAAGNASPGTVIVDTGGVLGLENDFDPTAILNAGSSGILSLNVANYSTALNQSALGNGEMHLGSAGDSTYSASSLGAGTGFSYRLGGAGGSLTFTETNTLTGFNFVTIGSSQTNGAGTVVLNAANNYTGATTVNPGSTLLINHAGALGSGDLNLNGGAIGSTIGTITVTNSVNLTGDMFVAPNSTDVELTSPISLTSDRSITVENPSVLTLSGSLSDGGSGNSITKSGTGELVLSGTNTFSGGITINAGTIRTVNLNQSLGSGTVTVNSGAALRQFSFLNLGGQSVLVETGGVLGLDGDFPPSVDPASSGIIAININGFSQALDMRSLGNREMFLGSQENVSYTLSTLGPGTGNAHRLGGGGGTLTITQPNVLTGFNTLLVGSTQTNGAGTVALGADQDFFGNALVESGSTLLLNGNLTGQGNVLVASGGTVKGGGIHNKSATINGALAPGNSAGMIEFADVVFNTGSIFEIEIGGLLQGTEYDFLNVTGTIDIFGGSLDVSFINGFTASNGDMFEIISADGGFGGTDFSGFHFPQLSLGLKWETDITANSYILSAVSAFQTDDPVGPPSPSLPEPSSLTFIGLLALGAACVGYRRRKGATGQAQ